MGDDGIELFVPGRLCLFGEHSDWAGGHRRQNSEIGLGHTIVVPTNQGTYAKSKKIDEPYLEFISQPFNEKIKILLKEKELLKIAQEGGIMSYVAGVAYEIVTNYQNDGKGIQINNYKTDLPIKKGLSSSASVCVLTARAFNEVFDLKWTKKRIMEIAYLGEITTPSRCGRMDQACAYDKPILMTYDGDRLTIEELKIGSDFYLLIVDLKSHKDTKKILTDLNKGFPFPTNEEEEKKHEYFKKRNPEIVMRAELALKLGDPEELGETMKFAQINFDRYLAPSCLPELTAPKLHQVLNLAEIQSYIWGGKGVGSGGDGSAQLVCKSKEDREKVKVILEKLGMECFYLDLKKN